MLVQFTTWTTERTRCRPVSVEASRVDIVEHYCEEVIAIEDKWDSEKYQVQIALWWGENGHNSIPAASRIVMRNKQEYIVQGTVAEVTSVLQANRKES